MTTKARAAVHGIPWGIFTNDDAQDGIHVAPVEWDETLARDHELTMRCSCQPALMYRKDGVRIWVHEVIQ